MVKRKEKDPSTAISAVEGSVVGLDPEGSIPEESVVGESADPISPEPTWRWDDPTAGPPRVVPNIKCSIRFSEILPSTVIVIVADGPAASLLYQAWTRAAAPAKILVISSAAALAETLEMLVADDDVPTEFVLVPSICIPTAKLSFADLTLYRRRVFSNGNTADNTGLPMLMSKEHITAALAAFESSADTSDEALVRIYNGIAHAEEIPTQVAFSFGNSVGYIARPDFCPARAIEFLLRRKFVCVTSEAFANAKRYLEEYVKK